MPIEEPLYATAVILTGLAAGVTVAISTWVYVILTDLRDNYEWTEDSTVLSRWHIRLLHFRHRTDWYIFLRGVVVSAVAGVVASSTLYVFAVGLVGVLL